MKRLVACFTALVMLIGVNPVFAEDAGWVMPIHYNGDVYAPVRKMCEEKGAEVSYNEATNFVTIVYNDLTTIFKPGDCYAFVNKKKVDLPYAVTTVNGTAIAPVSLIGSALGEKLYYDEERGCFSEGSLDSSGGAVKALEIAAVTANGHDGNVPDNTIDGNYGSRWSMEGVGSWICYELKEETEIGYAGIAFYVGNERITRFEIELSKDGVEFEKVYSGESELTLDMKPFTTKGQRAKYVRIVLNGNTLNLWNSIAEVKLFAPTSDGSMPLGEPSQEDSSGVDALEEILDEEQLEMYMKITETSKDALKWVASMYEPETGGFCYSNSAKDNPDIFGADLESTRQAVNYFQTYGLMQYIPDDLRDSIADYIQTRQNPETGYFVNPQHAKTTNARQLSRDMGCITTLKQLGRDPLYKTPGELLAEKLASQGETQEKTDNAVKNDKDMPSYMANMPSYMKSPEAYKQWIDGLSWERNSWTAGDTFMNSSTYIAQLPDEMAAPYWETAITWLTENQNTDTGDWGSCDFGVNISGAYKVITFLRKVPKEYLIDPVMWYPNSDKLFENILKCFPTYEHTSMLMTRNVTDILIYLRGQIPEDKLMEHMPDLIRYSYEDLLEYRFPDGSFSEKRGYTPASSGTGYNTAIGVAEGCTNVACSAEAVLNLFNAFYGVKKPKFDKEFADEIWQIMYDQSI